MGGLQLPQIIGIWRLPRVPLCERVCVCVRVFYYGSQVRDSNSLPEKELHCSLQRRASKSPSSSTRPSVKSAVVCPVFPEGWERDHHPRRTELTSRVVSTLTQITAILTLLVPLFITTAHGFRSTAWKQPLLLSLSWSCQYKSECT